MSDERDIVQQTDDYYVIHKERGTVHLQRKWCKNATDAPLSHYEELIVRLCAYILTNKAGDGL